MAKGLAVIQGRNKVVFKALEDGTINLGSADVSAAVTVKGSLKLDTGSQQDGYFLKTDASGQADWAQITTADVSGLDSELSVIDGRIDDVSAGLQSEILRATGREDTLSSAIEVNRADISNLRSEFDTLELEFDVLKGDFSVQTVLSNLAAIQEYLDGDGVSVAGVLSDIGDLTDYARSLSAAISQLSTSAGGDVDSVSAAVASVSAAVGSVSGALAQEIIDRTDADTALGDRIDNAISNSVVAVEGTAGEVDVVYTESADGRTAKVGLTNDVQISGQLTTGNQIIAGGNLTAQGNLFAEQNATVSGALSVAGDTDLQGNVNLGDSQYSVTAGNALDSVQVNGTFRIPHLTRQQALDMYGDGAALNDQATTIANGHDGHMFYLKDSDAASDADPMPEGNKWYFCENGIWHASFFYYA